MKIIVTHHQWFKKSVPSKNLNYTLMLKYRSHLRISSSHNGYFLNIGIIGQSQVMARS